MEHFYLGCRFFRAALQSMLVRCAYERREHRLRLERLRFEFWMELAANEVRMIRQFHHLDVSAVGGRSRNLQPRRSQRLFILAIEFVTMAVALADFGLAVNAMRQRSGFDLASPRAEPHGSAQFFHAAQLAQFVNHAMRR